MAWTSLPVKSETKERIAALDDKDGRDWDTFLRRTVLDEAIDGDGSVHSDADSLRLPDESEHRDAIQAAVDMTNGMELHNPDAGTFTVGDWLTYDVVPVQRPIDGGTEYYHVVDYSGVPAEYEGAPLSDRLMPWLQKNLNARGYFINFVDFEDERYVIQSTDLILRRVELADGTTPYS